MQVIDPFHMVLADILPHFHVLEKPDKERAENQTESKSCYRGHTRPESYIPENIEPEPVVFQRI
jgi:hypothetical protein